MKFENAKFIKSSGAKADYPPYNYPEYAFWGRSNVGKSSLINMILGKKNLVKTGSRPGMTQLINFFTADDTLSFADLPGYGYAKAPVSVKKGFTTMIKTYAEKRKNLRLAFLLIDIRRVPDEAEIEVIEMLSDLKIPVAVVLTKCDKVSGNTRSNNLNKISQALDISRENFFFSSTLTGEGKKELRRLIQDFKTTTISES